MRWLLFYCALCWASISLCKEITSLPGFKGTIPSKMYTGYLDAGDPETKMFYWFAESENDPANDPVALWVQGGPGASSVKDGLFVENGPFQFIIDSTGEPPNQLELRPFRWTRNASVIFWESPPGVGYSYCGTPNSNKTCGRWTDESTAQANYAFLCNFFQKYPQFRSNNFYITGESYAGIYIPMLAKLIQDGSCQINLKGLAIGNGSKGRYKTKCKIYRKYTLDVLHMHYMVPTPIYNNVIKHCYSKQLGVNWCNATEECKMYSKQASEAAGRYNFFDVYDTCPRGRYTFLNSLCSHRDVRWACRAENMTVQDEKQLDAVLRDPYQAFYQPGMGGTTTETVKHVPNFGDTGNIRCPGRKPDEYLRANGVREALGGLHEWGSQRYDYHSTLNSTFPLLRELASQYDIFIYSGDADTQVPYPGTEWELKSIGFPVTKPWRPWHLSSEGNPVAGYITEYGQTKFNSHRFSYITMKDAGHLVPHYTPRAAWEMFEALITGSPLV
eukprot:TRINITY_DN62506_c0_g2_i1.p1 TRINITY_DN62506_c0_g2~~TRINITY_DN62506_c0_g2_i1.p1  ORF type:complete len:501 (+),score=39.90 TRINITY_DN62506_c0_g2_i1:29-1531(+)